MIPLKDNIPTDRFGFVTLALIVANVVVYLLAIRHGGSFFAGPDNHEILNEHIDHQSLLQFSPLVMNLKTNLSAGLYSASGQFANERILIHVLQ